MSRNLTPVLSPIRLDAYITQVQPDKLHVRDVKDAHNLAVSLVYHTEKNFFFLL